IEAILATYQAVKEAVVIVRTDEPSDQRLVAYVVPRVGVAFEPNEARAILKAALPVYMIPAEFVVLTAMPLTPNGKVNRGGLPNPQKRLGPLLQAHPEIGMKPVQNQ